MKTNHVAHRAYEGLTTEHALSKNQVKNTTARTVAGTAVVFGPFDPGEYELVAVNDANDGGTQVADASITTTTGHADNLVYRFLTAIENTAAVVAVAASDHIWPASQVPMIRRHFTKDYPYISIVRATDSAKTMRISIAKVFAIAERTMKT